MKINLRIGEKAWLLVFMFLIVGALDARADINLTDDLTLSGMARYTTVMSIGTMNPYLDALNNSAGGGKVGKPRWNLLRSLLQLELNYKPTDIFRFYMKGRITHDQTYLLQGSDLNDYNTTTWTYEHHAADMKTGYGEDTFMAEIWELWANVETERFWIRLGKQQIAWGDLPGVRIADKFNPLDKSWHLTNEPEEFENIRIPEWAGRFYFSLPADMSGPFDEVYVDIAYNPGDLHPDMQPASGSPYMNSFSGDPYAGLADTGAPQPDPDYNDMRGEDKYGVRVGFNVGQLQSSFSYMSLYNDYAIWDTLDAPIEVVSTRTRRGTVYPKIDVYAMTLSYAWDHPWDTAMTLEASYTPNQPWQHWQGDLFRPGVYVPAAQESKYWRTAAYFERNVFWLNSLSRFFFPEKIGFMYYRHWIDEEDKTLVKINPAPYSDENRLDWAMDMFLFSYTVPFGEGAAWEFNPKLYWNPEGGYKIQSFLKYAPNYYWRFDLGAMWQGGSDENFLLPGCINTNWNDEMYFRITYSF
ncbi:hypothetical protein PITCH_A470007 [uncultured Desulfobacterium sp.]|uniref:Uncharacterized protein n=1 Tax=uncultured Desulfobacterium sp. TaxID=201089 RepID=A0A445N095_9BACT|nr:hypothetical protein PITCH_A470007 [uncultured Desulfobacterium sp.]